MLSGRLLAAPAVTEYPAAEALMRARARSFSLAARLLPGRERRATAVMYAFYRTLDDLVDEPSPGWTVQRVAAELDRWERWLAAGLPGAGPSPLCPEIGAVVRAHAIPLAPLFEMLEGQRADLWHRPPADFAALERYCQHVASSVGEAMCYVLGARESAAIAAARDLGVAMQLTNILRDVGEDLASGRCYLPDDERARFACPLQPTAGGRAAPPAWPDPALRALLRHQVPRARGYYRRGERGIWLLPPAVRPAILLAARLYERILDGIERADYDVFSRRIHPSRRDKLQVALRCCAELSRRRVQRAAC